MTNTTANSSKALAEMFARKYEQARQAGATDEQAIKACRLLWLEAISK